MAAAFAAFGHVVVISFAGYFVLQYHQWEAWELSVMVICAGAVGVVGNVIAGRLADRSGRRRVGFVFLAAFPLCAWCFYNGPGWSLPILWGMLVFIIMGGNVVIRALSSELFPTSHRGTSTGVLALMETLGAALGLLRLLFPETRQQELESISPAR